MFVSDRIFPVISNSDGGMEHAGSSNNSAAGVGSDPQSGSSHIPSNHQGPPTPGPPTPSKQSSQGQQQTT